MENPKMKIKRDGPSDTISYPKGMSAEQLFVIATEQERRDNYHKELIKVDKTFDAFPLEAARALVKAAIEKYGKIYQCPWMLGDKIIEPTTEELPIDYGKTERVPWGPFTVEGIEGAFIMLQDLKEGRLVMRLIAHVRNMYEPQVEEVVARAREILKTEGLYHGKAIKMRFRDDRGDLFITPPEFMDVSKPRKAIFARQIQQKINENILSLLYYPEEAREMMVSPKRTIFLYGYHGTGKTLLAYILAQEATKSDRTFVYVTNAAEYKDALRFVPFLGGPVMLFVEDINRVAEGERGKEMNELFNLMDGIDTKDANLITIFTANDVAEIHEGFLRDERVDAPIKVDSRDVESVEAHIRNFAGSFLDASEDVHDLAADMNAMHGTTPAFIAGVVKRAKLSTIFKSKGEKNPRLTAQALTEAFHEHRKERMELAMMRKKQGKKGTSQGAGDGSDDLSFYNDIAF